MTLFNYLSRLEDYLIYVGMPVVTAYHLLCSNIFLNTAAVDATGLEYAGNVALAPYRYLFVGQYAMPSDEVGRYDVRQYFAYQSHLLLKSTASVALLPFGLVIGSTLKGIAFLSEDVRLRHKAIARAVKVPRMLSNIACYEVLGLNLGKMETAEKIPSLGYARKEGDERHLLEEKQAFSEIARLLKAHEIPFWADCGTCLGAYRYGGVIPWDNDLDIAILEMDFLNMKHALSALDPAQYLVEDWSNRLLPNTYVRVYIRSTRQYIDIYTYAIHPELKTLQYICSNVNNMFLTEGWKINERRYMVETPFDVVFPLKIAEFDGIQVPVPNQTEKYLQMRYGENLAPVKVFNAKTDAYEKDLSHPYWQRAHAK